MASPTTTVSHHATAVSHPAAHHGATLAPAAPSTSSLFVHEIGAMLVVIGLLWVAARYMKKRSGITTGSKAATGKIRVLSRQALAKGISIAIVHVAGKDFLVGITPSGINLLSEIDLGSEPGMEIDPELKAFAESASVEPGSDVVHQQLLSKKLGAQWTDAQLGGASPLQAWMAKLDGLREMTVRRS